MTSTVPAPAPAPAPAAPESIGTAGPQAPGPDGTTSLTPTLRRLWHRSRWFLASAAVLLVTGLLLAGLGNTTDYPSLDPRSADPDGTKAIVQLLRDQGITVDVTADPAVLTRPGGDDTVLVPLPDLLGPDRLAALAGADHRRLVLISPGDGALFQLAPGVHAGTTAGGLPTVLTSASTAPGCDLPEAQRAGSAELGGQLYQVEEGTDALGCYPRDGFPALARTTSLAGTDVIVVGSGRFLTNQRLAHDGNAALALGLLGAHPHLTWLLPDYQAQATAAGPAPKSLTQLIPTGWHWAGVQLAIAVVLTALWRARRLGPVVEEQLPVVVRAAETTEGRARLYQKAKARGRAADALRRAARHRVAAVLGVPLGTGEPD
ncbi:DUF4350 domain-containing protein, partial [Kitasatospora sp. LaBMicrA B282]|uniref:DUF4350 domain-containing protein n=1 Tax=Kitasatospora sp. LaBMicrA B282 TaxID=3420949 RepID=UPI003D13051C